MNNAKNSNGLIILAIVAVVAILAYSFLNMPDRRNGMEKLGDAIHELPKGPDKAARELEDRTPGEKLGDAVKDAGNDIKRNTNQ
jgi:hypothetical protein